MWNRSLDQKDSQCQKSKDVFKVGKEKKLIHFLISGDLKKQIEYLEEKSQKAPQFPGQMQIKKTITTTTQYQSGWCSLRALSEDW